jgi:hypothetical protein
MSPPDHSTPPAGADEQEAGVLARLPRTRPQRSSARRIAARASTTTRDPSEAPQEPLEAPQEPVAERRATAAPVGASANGRAKPATRKPSQGRNRAAGAGSARRQRTGSQARRGRDGTAAKPAGGAPSTPAPRQGFECESEHPSRTINPPGSAELVASLADMLGELAKAGLSTGERLLRDAFSRLPLS